MIRSDFFEILKKSLESISKEERDKFITYYEEIIEDYKENGLTEEEALTTIGNPQNIANDILNEQGAITVKTPSSNSNILNILLLILGFPLWGSLLLAGVLILFSIYIIIWCIPLVTGVSSITFFLASLVSIVGAPFMIFDIPAVGVVQLGIGFASIGISVLLAFLTIFLSKRFMHITKNFTFRLYKILNKKVVKLW